MNDTNEAQDITPSERVELAQAALEHAQQKVIAAQEEHQRASAEYVNALRDYHRHTEDERAAQMMPTLPPRTPVGRDDQR